jgi:hypothetical protein
VAQQNFSILVEAADRRTAGQAAHDLAVTLREVSGVLDAGRQKEEQSTMDLGAIVTIIATSSATAVVARVIADWLRRRRGTRLVIRKDPQSGSIKAEVENIDPAAATRTVELIVER